MSLQPGMPAVPAFGGVVNRDLDDDLADTVRDEPGTMRDPATGEPVGRSDHDADVAGSGSGSADEQAVNQEALDAFVQKDREGE